MSLPSGPKQWSLVPGSDGYPIASLDEHASAVIDGVLYIASGYVWNWWSQGVADAYATDDDYCWPFLERFDLATRTWLPRIPMPLGSGIPAVLGQPVGTVVNEPGAVLSGGDSYYGNYQDTGLLVSDFRNQTQAPPMQGAPAAGWGYVVYPDGAGPDTAGATHRGIANRTATPSGVAFGNDGVTPEPWSGRVWAYNFFVGDPLPPLDNLRALVGGTSGAPPHPYAAEGNIGGAIDGKFYFGGGDGSYITGKEFFCFDPATETFTRLADAPDGAYPDYVPYWVHEDTLCFSNYALQVNDGTESQAFSSWVYDSQTGAWTLKQVPLMISLADAGVLSASSYWGPVQIGTKHYAAQSGYIIEYDFTAGTVQTKVQLPSEWTGLNVDIPVAGDDGRLWIIGAKYGPGGVVGNTVVGVYDPSTDSFETTVLPTFSKVAYQIAWAVYQGVPYLASGAWQPGADGPALGVYTLTAALIGSSPNPQKLRHLGLNERQVRALTSNPTALDLRRAGFSRRQTNVLLGERTERELIRAGFNRYQAKALL